MLRQEIHSGNTYVRLVADLGHLSPVVVPITALCAAYEGQLLRALPAPRGLWLQSRINGFTLRTCLALRSSPLADLSIALCTMVVLAS